MKRPMSWARNFACIWPLDSLNQLLATRHTYDHFR